VDGARNPATVGRRNDERVGLRRWQRRHRGK
jgi:hypothetical protein